MEGEPKQPDGFACRMGAQLFGLTEMSIKPVSFLEF
jgi:hypothetical protein